jgi:nitrate reductase gamma subunit
LVAPLPWLIKLHVFNFFLLLGIFPFSRLVHIVTLPLGYILRPWQIIIANKRTSNLYQD